MIIETFFFNIVILLAIKSRKIFKMVGGLRHDVVPTTNFVTSFETVFDEEYFPPY